MKKHEDLSYKFRYVIHGAFMKLISFFYLIVIFGLSVRCSHQDVATCQEPDWYEIGRADGLKGLQHNQSRQIEVLCPSSDQSLAEAFYNNGFDTGIASFCSPKTGFELGKSNQKVNPETCPLLLRTEFIAAHNNGKRFVLLKSEHHQISKRLSSIEGSLSYNKVDVLKRGILHGEKLELLEKSKIIENELQSLNSYKSALQINE